MLIKPYYPVTLTIDDEAIVFRIKRMTYEEFAAFADRSARVATSTIARFTSRADSGPEQERDEHGQYRASFEQLCEDRLSTMAADDRDRFLAATQADEDEARVFLKDIFEQFVTVEKGITEETADGREVSVTSGLDVLRLFGARSDVLTQVMTAVHTENTLDATQKHAAASASPAGFRQPKKGRAGRRPARTASRAETEASAGTEGATSARRGPSVN